MAPSTEEKWLWATLVVVSVVAVIAHPQDETSAPCPDACSCPNIPPALGLVCNGRNLTSIPVINISVHFLDFSGNPLKSLTNQTLEPIRSAHNNLEILVLKACAIDSINNDTFDKVENLKFVDLSTNGISTLEPGVFTRLLHLSEINLSENNLKNISTHWFAESAPLRVLNLTANPIAQLEANAFARLTLLEELRLDQCAIHNIDPHAFDGLFKLHTLNLSHNHLRTLTPDSITWLRELHTLELNENPWQCDCNLQGVTVVLLMRGFQRLANNLTCAVINNEISKWIDVNSTQPDCESQIRLHARKTTLIGNSAKHRKKMAQLLSTSAPSALLSSQMAATSTTSSYSAVVTIGIWSTVIMLVAIGSYAGIYITSKICVYVTTKAAVAAKHATRKTKRQKSIVRRDESSECEQSLVNETDQFRDHFYLVDEVNSDGSISMDV